MAAPDLGQITQEEYEKLSPEEKAQAEANVRQAQSIANATPPQTPQMPDEAEQRQLLQRYQEAQQGGQPLTPEETQKIQTLQQIAQQQSQQYQQNNQAQVNPEGPQKPGFWKSMKGLKTMDYVKLSAAGLAAAAVTGGGSLLAGLGNAAATMGSYVAANYFISRKDKKAMSSDQVKKDGYLGAAVTPFLYTAFKGLKSIANPYLTTAVGLGLMVPAFQAFFWPMRHLINNYTPMKLVKRIFKKDDEKGTLASEIYNEALKPNFWKGWKDTVKYLGIPIHFVWNYLPLQAQLPATAVTRTAYKYVLERSAVKNGEAPKQYDTEQTKKVMPNYSPN